ncbi:MAG: transglutaminase domain-containing protein [Ignavibacteria bacterium]|nr:transglutaminase domain-containing protein [Ignavibacteria bacterium]
MILRIILLSLISISLSIAQTKFPEINLEISNGNFSNAIRMIDKILCTQNLSPTDIYELNFEKERMERIKKDFTATEEEVISYIKKYYPDLTQEMILKWENERALEFMIIDGKKLYFNNADANLFRIDKEAKKQKQLVDGIKPNKLEEFLLNYLPKVVEESKKENSRYVKPIKLKLNYTLTVNADVVPEGEVLRCWLPFPRETARQKNVKLLSVNSSEYVVADNNHQQRTIYIEKVTEKNKPTEFNFEVEYIALNEWTKIEYDKLKPYNTDSELFKNYTAERPPHIVFTDEIKKLSEKIVGREKNPYLIAKKIFTWIDENIPWASAREYSTIEKISDYCVKNMHGDCGIKTLLFITLCRYNGIPAKWQSGWMLHPPEVNLHDWGEIYFENYGWVPVDQSFGIKESDNEDVKYFFLGGMDAYRLVCNDDYSSPLFPAKIFPRSETVDFQRGEVEWRGGNLYFDSWRYKMKVEYSE